jgi:ABC-2 type transport system ATP-binding protein
VALVEAARRAGITVASLSVQSTTLDDVFVRYTGHQLRDSLQSAPVYTPVHLLERK